METIPNNFTLTSSSPGFVKSYFKASRLHHLSSWKADLIDYVAKFTQKSQKPSQASDAYRVIMHVDMDCFFASVGIRDRPHLKGRPVAVAHSTGGINLENSSSEIASCNYEARARGIKNGMFIGSIKKLAPDLVIIPYEFEKYDECSKTIYQILLKEADFVQAVSCDEAYIDVTARLKAQLVKEGFLSSISFTTTAAKRKERVSNSLELLSSNQAFGTSEFAEEEEAEEDQQVQTRLRQLAVALAEQIRNEISSQTRGCAASVGISHNMLLARLATQRAKPNGSYYLAAKDMYTLLNPLPIQQLPGFGFSIVEKCQQSSFSISTCQDVRSIPFLQLQQLVGEKTAQCLLQYSQGIDPRILENKPRQSIGSDINWGIRFTTSEQLTSFLREFTEEVFERLQMHDYRAGHLTVSMKKKLYQGEPGKFLGCGHCQDYSKSMHCSPLIDQCEQLYQMVVQLVQEINLEISEIRGIGIHLKKLQRKSFTLEGTFLTVSKSTSSSSSGSSSDAVGQVEVSVSKSEDLKSLAESANRDSLLAKEDATSSSFQRKATMFHYYAKDFSIVKDQVSNSDDLSEARGGASQSSKPVLSSVISLCDDSEDEVAVDQDQREGGGGEDSRESAISSVSLIGEKRAMSQTSSSQRRKRKTSSEGKKDTGGGGLLTLRDYFSTKKTQNQSSASLSVDQSSKDLLIKEQLARKGVDVDFFFSLPAEIQAEQLQLLNQLPG